MKGIVLVGGSNTRLHPVTRVRWYLDNQEWMGNITSGEYERYYEEMYSK